MKVLDLLLRRMRLGLTTVLLLSLFAGCTGVFADRDDNAKAEDAPAPATADVRLIGVVAGLVGQTILFQNHGAEPLDNVLIVLNQGGAEQEYRSVVKFIGPNTTTYYMATRFKNDLGAKFDQKQVKVMSVSVFADTPRGRGLWQGTYRVSP